MSEETANLETTLTAPAEPQATGSAVVAFPTEAFPCPHCGQMLGPGVRVCAACRRSIDPAQVRVAVAEQPAAVAPQRTPVRSPNTPFPWTIFLLGLLGVMVVSAVFEARFGLQNLRYLGSIPPLSAVWVVFDARRKGVSRPLQWGVGTMLLWFIVFPWYLARRRLLNTVCPFVESGARSVLRIVLLWLLINILALLFLGSALNSFPK